MFEWWKDLLRPIRRDDPQFGRMLYLRQSKTWEATAPFAPLGRDVEVLIDGEEAGPAEWQRERYRELERRYPELWPPIEQELTRLFTEHQIHDDVPMNLAGIALPIGKNPDYDVELTYGDVSGPPQFDVRIQDWRVTEVIGPV